MKKLNRENYKAISVATMKKLYLPKWAGCRIVGNKVSSAVAMEFVRRTDIFFAWSGFCNNPDWQHLVADTCRMPCLSDYAHAERDVYHKKLETFRKKWKYIKLSSLYSSVVASAYVFGPYAVIDTKGNIDYFKNVGKYATTEEVFNDLKAIARNFKMVKLRCTLYNDEYCSLGDSPLKKAVVTFWVEDGKVYITEPVDEEIVGDGGMCWHGTPFDPERESAVDERIVKKWAASVYGAAKKR